MGKKQKSKELSMMTGYFFFFRLFFTICILLKLFKQYTDTCLHDNKEKDKNKDKNKKAQGPHHSVTLAITLKTAGDSV